MEELRKYILAKAIQNNICKPWAEKITLAASPDDLLQMYVDGIDFCLSNNYPSNDDLVHLVGDYLPGYGIHVDDHFSQVNSRFAVLLGNSFGQMKYTEYQTAQVFVKHQSKADLILSGNSFVMLDCFDESKVSIMANDASRITVNIYGNAHVSHEGSGTIKIIHKLKETY